MQKIKNEIYVVRSGDTLNSIANDYKINPTIILIQNAITPKLIKEGMILYIPKKQ